MPAPATAVGQGLRHAGSGDCAAGAAALLRFPFDTCSAAALQAVAGHGQLAIQWDVVTGDPDPGRSAKAIAATILAKAHPGAIVVAHANGRGRNTADALTSPSPSSRRKAIVSLR